MAWFSGPGLASQEVRHAATQAVESRSRFLAAASHDLRQPFQAMRFFHSVLADLLVSAPARRASDMLGAALTSGEQLLTALLDISTLEAGTVTAEDIEQQWQEQRDDIAAAIEFAEESPVPDVAQLLEDVYSTNEPARRSAS